MADHPSDRLRTRIRLATAACVVAVVALLGSTTTVYAGATIPYLAGASHGGWHRSGFKTLITGGAASVWYPDVAVHIRTVTYGGVQASATGPSFVYLHHPAVGWAESNCRTIYGSQFDCYYFRP